MLPANRRLAKEWAFLSEEREIKKNEPTRSWKINMSKSMPADMDIHICCMYVCAWDIYLYAGKRKYKIYVYVYTYILEGYMHMHAHLVFTLYVKYLQFLIFIQYTKMLHELKNSLQKETYQTMYNSCSKFKLKFNFQFV